MNKTIGRLAIMGNIDVLEPDGEKVNYPMATLVAFDSSDELRQAVENMEVSLINYHDDKADAEKKLYEPKVKKLTFDENGLNAQFEGGACGLLANAFVEQFKEHGSTNFLEVGFYSDEIGRVTVTIQREEGFTPAQKIEQIKQLIRDGQIDEALSF